MHTATLASQLDRLRAIEIALAARRAGSGPEDFVVFGAESHGYRSTPLSRAEVDGLEARLKVGLPSDYRDFLLRVGAGAGPDYGLLGVDDLLAENADRDPSGDFPFTRADADRIYDEWCAWLRNPDRSGGPADKAPWDSPGCIAISHQGCGHFTMLVTTGELAGSVWHGGDSWRPATAKAVSGPMLSFTAWYGAWVREALVDLSRR